MAFLAKRRFPRILNRDGVKLYAEHGIEYATFEDVSAVGIRLFLDREPRMGEHFRVEFRLPRPQALSGAASSHFSLKARVVRVIPSGKGYEVGLEFLEGRDRIAAELHQGLDTAVGPH